MANLANWPTQPNSESGQAVNESSEMVNPAKLPLLLSPLSLFFQLSVSFAAFAVFPTFHLLRCFPCFSIFPPSSLPSLLSLLLERGGPGI
jgi:hypothetical protein